MDHQTDITSRAALGQIAALGDLYDARTDGFCGISAFKKSLDPDALKLVDNHFSDIRLIHKDTFSEKFSKLDVRAELQVSVLAGLFTLSGSGRYLKDEKTSCRSVKSTLLYNITTKDESLNIYHENIKNAFALEAIESGKATHVVVGITWGANSLLTCEYLNSENRDVTEIEGSLSATLQKLSLSISGKASVDFKEGDNSKNISFDIRIYGDVLPQGQELPTTVEGALNLMKQMPNLVSTCNQGRGKPLTYRMIPISLLKDYLKFSLKADHMIKSLGEDCILRVVQFFDQLALVRQQINDFHQDATTHRFCVPSKSIREISTLKEDYTIYEAKFRSKLADTLTAVRSGSVDMTELENCLRNYQSSNYSPEKLSALFSTWNDISEKISFAKSLVQHGATYIGFGRSLDDEIIKNFADKAFVLYFKTDAKFQQPDEWKKNRQVFLQEVKKGGSRYFAVDCDIHQKLWPKSGKICVEVLQTGQVLSKDWVAEQEMMDSTPFAKTTLSMKRIVMKPNKRGRLLLRCTGINCNPNAEYQWMCLKCRTSIEYGFDSYFYCECGKAPASTYEFHCTDPKHGFAFEKFSDSDFLQQLLDRLRPFKDVNILILGETGVGKSTWINGFINYLTFDSLKDAEEDELRCLIPGKFTVFDKDYNQITVTTGDDKNEVQSSGQSATQDCKVYSFPIDDDTTIRLIDTPGIGDTRGVTQDAKNFENILKTIANMEELHGICILLKPNNSRVTVMFRFCIKELLTYLHRDACHNIMFCFTNSRGTFYRPGDTMIPLKALLDENKDVEISLSSHTIYCYDSEAYRFLAAVQNNVEFSEDEREDFAQSWNKSKKEIERMLKHIDGLKPHNIHSTLSLNHARELVGKLARPLAEINKAVLTTKKMLEDEKKEIQTNANYMNDLEKKKTYKKQELDIVRLDYPKTVCTSDKCKQFFGPKDALQIKYVTECHNPCGLNGVTQDVIGHEGLMYCAAMTNNFCDGCTHSYKVHMHIYYDSVEVSKDVEDETVVRLLKQKMSDNEKRKALIESKDVLIKEYNNEQQVIERASVRFAYFLKSNAITPYNDGMLEYMDHLIKEEESKINVGGSADTLKELLASKASYKEKIKILDSQMEMGDKDQKDQSKKAFSPEEIDKAVKELYGLKHYGKDIKEALDSVTYTQHRNAAYNEVTAPRHKPFSAKKWIKQQASNAVTKVANFFNPPSPPPSPNPGMLQLMAPY